MTSQKPCGQRGCIEAAHVAAIHDDHDDCQNVVSAVDTQKNLQDVTRSW